MMMLRTRILNLDIITDLLDILNLEFLDLDFLDMDFLDLDIVEVPIVEVQIWLQSLS